MCPNCAYASAGTPEICFNCASEVIDQIPGPRRCKYCDGALTPSGACGNPLCSQPEEQRCWRYVHPLAARSGVLERVINAYKYENVRAGRGSSRGSSSATSMRPSHPASTIS
jgi:predicted amidophosphoribosyltransferase